MKRKDFLKKSLAATAVIGLTGAVRAATETLDEKEETVGFNHLPNKEEKIMNTVIHRAETRGHANHGWLNSYHTFSFANYQNPQRTRFGVLRVLNDDTVAPGMGFGTHPHDNMEIISIPLEGALEHKDSMGNTQVIREGDIQIMSAGTGITHSEYNKNKDREVKFLQIWVFPNRKNLTPRYDQLTLDRTKMKNKLYQVLSPTEADEGVFIHQDAWFHLTNLDKEKALNYTLKKPGNGVYVFVLKGEAEVAGVALKPRDGMGITDATDFSLKATSNTELLVMEVPLQLN